jgi:predicted nucleic acid-binding protein
MFLVDTNIFLEILLGQDKKKGNYSATDPPAGWRAGLHR